MNFKLSIIIIYNIYIKVKGVGTMRFQRYPWLNVIKITFLLSKLAKIL